MISQPRAECAGALEWRRDLHVRASLVISHDGVKTVGPRFIRLLREIESRGSIRQASLSLGIGYRHAIEWIQRAERVLDRPVVRRRAGGGPGGGASLTREGKRLVVVYDRVGRDIVRRLARAEMEFFPDDDGDSHT